MTTKSFDRETLRRSIVARVWSDGLRVELVDRLVELVEIGAATEKELDDAVRRAASSARWYQETNGDKGARAAWIPLTGFCKEKWGKLGRTWTVPASRLEPRPVIDDDGGEKEPQQIVYRNQDGFVCILKTYVLTAKQAQDVDDYVAMSSLKFTRRELRRIINDYSVGVPLPRINDPLPPFATMHEFCEFMSDKLKNFGKLPAGILNNL